MRGEGAVQKLGQVEAGQAPWSCENDRQEAGSLETEGAATEALQTLAFGGTFVAIWLSHRGWVWVPATVLLNKQSPCAQE